MKKLFSLTLAGILALSLAACGGSTSSFTPEASAPPENSSVPAGDDAAGVAATGSVVIRHEYGETEVAVNPEKIFVGDLGILDIFSELGIEIAGLPTTANLPAYLGQYGDSSKYTNMGSMKEVDFEAVNEAAPDVVFISGRLASQYDELSAIAPTVYVANPGATYLESMLENIEVLKAIFPAHAEALDSKMNALLDEANAIKAKAEATGYTALVVMANEGSISFFSAGSRYGIVFDSLGFTPVAENIEDSTHGAEGSFEFFTEVDPDVIFVIDRSAAVGTGEGDSGAAQLLDNDIVNATTAAREGRIIYLSSDVWYLASGGFTGTAQMLQEVAVVLS